MARQRHRFNRKKLLAALAAITITMVILPREITGRLISLAQVIVPFQDWFNRSAGAAKDALSGDEGVISPEEWHELVRENQALTHQLTALASRYEALDRQHAALAGIRHRGLTGGRLVSARVVASDASPLNDSRLVNAGRLSGVREGAAAASSYFTIENDEADDLQSGMSILSGEALVGFVDQVGTHAARIRLLSDTGMELTVTIARLADGKYYPLDADFWMVGTGANGSGLEIRDVSHRYIRDGAIQEGDFVLTSPIDTRLPAPLNVGVVSRIQPDPDNALLYRLEVTPAVDYARIRSVFVVDPRSEAQ